MIRAEKNLQTYINKYTSTLDYVATTCLLSMICLCMFINQCIYELQGAWSGPWVSTEVLAALIGIVVYYIAYSTKSAIQA